MRELVVNAFVSLDGVMQALGAPEEDPTGGFTHGGWSVGYWDDQMMGLMAEGAPYELLPQARRLDDARAAGLEQRDADQR
jgi:hypothetical protein